MSGPERSNRSWVQRARSIHDRRTRDREGICYIEGIRQVLAARESSIEFEAVLVDPSRLRSERAWLIIEEMQLDGIELITLRPSEFERMSGRDNPFGLAAIVRWGPGEIRYADPAPDEVYLATDDIRDPGNLGTLIRTVDALGAGGIIIHRGTDAAHPNSIRASLGAIFRTRVYQTISLDELFYQANTFGLATVATSAGANENLNETAIPLPALIIVGNEGNGLDQETIERSDLAVRVPQSGTATSLNVSVAAGIVLYEVLRRSG